MNGCAPFAPVPVDATGSVVSVEPGPAPSHLAGAYHRPGGSPSRVGHRGSPHADQNGSTQYAPTPGRSGGPIHPPDPGVVDSHTTLPAGPLRIGTDHVTKGPMTGGRVAELGKTGKNFAAGMSGGIAYVLDENSHLYRNLNKAMIAIEKL